MYVHLNALGCRLNEAELEAWARGFQAQGHRIALRPEQADMIVINTCAVTREAVRKSRQLIRRAHRRNTRAKLVVSGCYSTLEPGLAGEIEGIDLIVPNHDKDRLVEITTRVFDHDTMPSRATAPGETVLFPRGRNRAFIKIQDGCRNRCSFCIITVARGRERSRPVKDIVSEINFYHARGINEAVLTGVHAGGYGSDIGSTLYALIRAILADSDIPRLRLASVEPWDLQDNFFDLFSNPRLMPHIHLPLQNGCDTVLRRMARRCMTSDFTRLVDHARACAPDFNITTDIIVGFPGESDREWECSLRFIEKTGFSHIHIFPYSARSGTRAAAMPDQVAPEVKRSRARALQALALRMKAAWHEKHLGRVFPVLWEGKTRRSGTRSVTYYGYTPNYIRARANVPRGLVLENAIRPARMISVSQDGGEVAAEPV